MDRLSLLVYCLLLGLCNVAWAESERSSMLKSEALESLALNTATIKPFVRGSMKGIESARKGQQFIVSLWSIDCPSCYEELAMWRSLKEKYPALDVVLISTDDLELQQDVQEVIDQLGVGNLALWQFSDSFAAALRFEIDSRWSGELPRTYFYSATGESVGRSGVVEQSKIEAWIEQNTQ
ncbi:MAG: hypothetical protein COB04_02755 [Gammaproteobacteria bacterium]|nr:MAG: hypothetical protein COB04_02755 [Gammaproteobacteria bacterium]